jgi:hypothetical protein
MGDGTKKMMFDIAVIAVLAVSFFYLNLLRNRGFGSPGLMEQGQLQIKDFQQ